MRKIIALTLFLISTGLAVAQVNSGANADNFKKLEWLLGKWVLKSQEAGITGTETWSKISPSEFNGLGFTLTGNDSSFEKIKIVEKAGDIFFVADLKEKNEPVYFKVTLITNREFACENPQHDFPKKIIYKTDANGLKATISGDGKSIDYYFEKR